MNLLKVQVVMAPCDKFLPLLLVTHESLQNFKYALASFNFLWIKILER